nr:hypothetical protein [Tanacetum cinerariifolium]
VEGCLSGAGEGGKVGGDGGERYGGKYGLNATVSAKLAGKKTARGACLELGKGGKGSADAMGGEKRLAGK